LVGRGEPGHARDFSPLPMRRRRALGDWPPDPPAPARLAVAFALGLKQLVQEDRNVAGHAQHLEGGFYHSHYIGAMLFRCPRVASDVTGHRRFDESMQVSQGSLDPFRVPARTNFGSTVIYLCSPTGSPSTISKSRVANPDASALSELISTTTPACLSGVIMINVLVPCCPPPWPTSATPPVVPVSHPSPYSSFEPSDGFCASTCRLALPF